MIKFGIRAYTVHAGIKILLLLRAFNKEFKINLGRTVDFHWKKEFQEYFAHNNIRKKTSELKQNMDIISCQYIDKFVSLSKVWDWLTRQNIWTEHDEVLLAEFEKFRDNFQQPFADTYFDPFIFFSKYGLNELPQNDYNKINGKVIIDIGGYTGDTAFMFNQNFPDSKILVYEPYKGHYETIEKLIKTSKSDNIHAINKGLGNKTGQEKIYNDEISVITTLDHDFKDCQENIGLIKMDVEGYEFDILSGAVNIIKKHKPILITAIYHKPEHFFEMKNKIHKINPEYKFMIRRSEAILPQADIILIAF